MGNKVFKALTAVAAAAAAVWLLPKRKKEMAVRPIPAGESMSCIRERTGVESGCSLPVLLSPRQVDGKGCRLYCIPWLWQGWRGILQSAPEAGGGKEYADRLSGVDGKEVSRRGMVSGRRHHGYRRTYP